MGKNTNISWTDATWNPWQGCHKVSAGCLNCYMFREKKRFGQDPETVVRSKPPTFNAPLKWKDPAKVFVCSWSDFFIEEADPWRDEAWEIMRETPHLTYQILTKRPENIEKRLPYHWPFSNVWLGVTAENDEMFRRRVPYLLFDIPVKKRFVSIEPMIGPVDISNSVCKAYSMGHLTIGRYLNWIIIGGESGPNARIIKPEWVSGIKRLCKETCTPFFLKQMSGGAPIPDYLQCQEFPR